jgi:hypothetical protein
MARESWREGETFVTGCCTKCGAMWTDQRVPRELRERVQARFRRVVRALRKEPGS